MKKNISLFVFFSFLSLFFAQNNQVIKYPDGTLVRDSVYFCSGESFSLETEDYQSSGSKSWTREDVSKYRTIFSTSVGEIDVPFSTSSRDNVFSNAISLGFNVEFFGKTYSKVVVGTNGRVLMSNSPELDNLNNSTLYSDKVIDGVPLPSNQYNQVSTSGTAELPLAQIFAGFTNLRSQVSNTFYRYKPVTFEGRRGMVFIFQEVIPHNGSGGDRGGRFTSRILIFEDGEIVIDVSNKTNPRYNAILGMQDETATEFLVPIHSDSSYNYNNGNWISEFATVFAFQTGMNRTPTYEWKINGVVQASTNRFLAVSPNDNDRVSVKVTFAEDTDGSMTETGAILFKTIQKPEISETYGNCGDPVSLKVNNYDAHLIYDWFSSAAPTTVMATGETFLATSTGTYFARVKSSATAGYCQESDHKSVVLESAIPAFSFAENKVFSHCDQNPSGTKTVNLLSEIGYTLGSDYTVKFFENSTEITNYTNYTINSGDIKTLKVVVETNAGVVPCSSSTRDFSLKYWAFPAASTNFVSEKLCEGTAVYSVSDFKAKYPQFSVYDISFSTNRGTTFGATQVNPSANSTVLVRFSHPDFSCEFNYEFNFQFHPSVIANAPTTVFPAKCETNSVFNLASLKPEINPSSSVDISFYLNLADAQNGANPIPANYQFPVGVSEVFIRVKDNDTQCVAVSFPSFNLNVFAKPAPNSYIPRIEKCEGETFNLTQNVDDFFASINPDIHYEIKYFAPNGTQLLGTQIASYQPNDFGANGLRPYLEIHYSDSCFSRVDYRLIYNELPKSSIPEIPVCEEVSFSLSDFKNRVITNASDYIFTDESGAVLAQDFSLTSLPKTVKFYIENKITGCKSTLQEVTFKKLNDVVLDNASVDFTICDTTNDVFDGKTVFNLTTKNTEIKNLASANFQYYKDIALTQEIATPENYINEFPEETIYVKVSVSGFCPSVAEIKLKVNTPTKSTTLREKYFICYGTSVFVDAGAENVSFVWSDGQNNQTAIFSQAGSYSVVLRNAEGCSYTHSFIISDENQPKIQSVHQDNDRVEVLATGNYPIEYSFNGSAFGASNILLNPTDEEYEIRVRSVIDEANGEYCLGEPVMVFNIKIPNAITPNGDGINDVWEVKNLEKMEQVEVVIADRFGKTVFASTDKNALVWDGKSNGRILPTATYWYVVKWYDPARKTNEIRQGWVLLKNRN